MSTTQFIQNALTDDVKSQNGNAVKRLDSETVQVTLAGDNDQIVYSTQPDEEAVLLDGDYKTAEEVLQDTDYQVEEREGELYIEKN
jgi:hypothetical protein